MNQLDEIKEQIKQNQEIIEHLTVKRQQEDQMRKLDEKRKAAELDERENPKYVTKVVAAQEVITYILKFKVTFMVILISSIAGAILSIFIPIVSLVLLCIAAVMAIIGLKKIADSQKYLVLKYKLPGYENINKPKLPPGKNAQPYNNKQGMREALGNFFNN